MADSLRERREREFRNRVLKAIEKERPKPNRFWALINSRLFTAIVLGSFVAVIGGYFTHYQQCISDAERIGEAWSRRTREAMTRQESLGWVIKNAKTLDEIRSFKAPTVYSELKDKPLFEVLRERNQFAPFIDLSATKSIPSDAAIPGRPYNAWEYVRYGRIAAGTLRPEIQESELPDIKDFVERYFGELEDAYSREFRVWLYPRCDLKTVLPTLIGKRTKILEASTASTPSE
jgi:hypothetical protein